VQFQDMIKLIFKWLYFLFSNVCFYYFSPAIDFVIGGPPCVDFSGINADRQGIEGYQGSYMMKFASLIHKIKKHALQNENPLFFLCENVPISIKHGLLEIEDKFQVVGVTLDAKYLSPCKRNRMYFTNVSLFVFVCFFKANSTYLKKCFFCRFRLRMLIGSCMTALLQTLPFWGMVGCILQKLMNLIAVQKV